MASTKGEFRPNRGMPGPLESGLGSSRKWRQALAEPGGRFKLIDTQGRTYFGLRLSLPTPFRASLLEALADLAEELAGGELRFNASGEVELVTASEEQAAEAWRRALKLGLSGNGLRPNQVNHCPGLLFCHRAAVDTLGPALAVSAILARKKSAWPAPLKISICGCTRRCELDLTSDLLIEGRFLKPPSLDHAYLNNHPGRGELVAECPGQALALKITAVNGEYFNSLELDEDKCLVCGRCGFERPGFIFTGGPNGAAFNLYIGGRLGPDFRTAYPRPVREYLPNNPSRWPELAKAVSEITDDWQTRANPGERLIEYARRLGWPAWIKNLGWPVTPGLLK